MSEQNKTKRRVPPEVVTGNWSEVPPPRRKDFPGPAMANEALRVAISRSAYASLVGHARESLDVEVCGVLVGEMCEDDRGVFLSIEGFLPGTKAREGGTHVTFTQETWTEIHGAKEKRYPKLQIVGWYHTHPGFGVEFSEMDLFVQKNFFSAAGQIAYVIDPLGGDESILANTTDGIVPVRRFWVDGRERRCSSATDRPEGGAVAHIPKDVEASLRAMEERVSQLMVNVEAQGNSLSRFLSSVFIVAATGIVLGIAYWMYNLYTHDFQPPQGFSYVPVPVQIGDKSCLIGIAVAKWDVPPELNAAFIAVERERRAAEEKALKEKQAATQPAQATTQPAADEQKGKNK